MRRSKGTMTNLKIKGMEIFIVEPENNWLKRILNWFERRKLKNTNGECVVIKIDASKKALMDLRSGEGKEAFEKALDMELKNGKKSTVISYEVKGKKKKALLIELV